MSRDHFMWIFPWWLTVYASAFSFNNPKPSPTHWACSWTWCQSCVNSTYRICFRRLFLTCQYGHAYLMHASWGGNKGLASQTFWCLWVSLPHICRRFWESQNVRAPADCVGCVHIILTTLGKGAQSICVPHISHVTVWMKHWQDGVCRSTHLTQASGNSPQCEIDWKIHQRQL